MRLLNRNQRITGLVHCQLKCDLDLKVNLPPLGTARAFQDREVEITVVCLPVASDMIHTFMTRSN